MDEKFYEEFAEAVEARRKARTALEAAHDKLVILVQEGVMNGTFVPREHGAEPDPATMVTRRWVAGFTGEESDAKPAPAPGTKGPRMTKKDREKRDAQIARDFKKGKSIAALAEKAGVRPQQIRKILKRTAG